jgi:hypothetical protein
MEPVQHYGNTALLEQRELAFDVTLLLSHPQDLSLDAEDVLCCQGKSGISERGETLKRQS